MKRAEGGGGGAAGKSERLREWLTDRVEQLSGKSLLSSAALTSMSPD